MELQLALAILVVMSMLLCTILPQILRGWFVLQQKLELQEAGRYMLACLERELGQEASSITLKKNFNGRMRIEAQSINGNRSFTFACDGSALNKTTKTGNGSGTNPVYIPGINVVDWRVQALDEKRLLITFVLQLNGRKQEFCRLVFLNNGRVMNGV